MSGFDMDETLRLVSSWKGWLRDAQARRLWEAAQRVQAGGRIVEIGSYHGKSTVVMARAAPPDVELIAIDPHAGNDRGPGEWTGAASAGEQDHKQFLANLRVAGVAGRVRHVREYSQAAHGDVVGDVDLLYIDGAHGYQPASDDIVGWGGRVTEAGEMHIHDVYNSAFVTLAVLRHLAISGRWVFLGRERSLATYRRMSVTPSGRLRNLARHLASLPWFARNMVIKALRSAGVERFGRLLGHRPGDGMY